MTTIIPHSLDAVIVALQAVIDGRPIPENWQTESPALAPTPAVLFDEIVLMQGISDLIDQKIAAIAVPPPEAQSAIPAAPDPELIARVEKLERASAAVPPGFEEAVLLVLDIQKSQTHKNDDLEGRVTALETIMLRLGAAVHKEQAA